ncbi:hypothetical protein KX729_28345 [Rhizobium sp. XQZ8]|uniref:hypothetical protein n=1 Tax=Rhizobium populisoli TaxID=2859785 RepID=UPI001CA5A993|nr:hypothetical protein [Rhizobium populisoli]MBW6425346.1 hypothetical protein [Rhizobium populisoli]
MNELRSLRAIIDRFCAEQGLSIASAAGMDAARHCLAQAAARNLDERQMLVELYEWYQLYAKRTAGVAVAENSGHLRDSGNNHEQVKAA